MRYYHYIFLFIILAVIARICYIIYLIKKQWKEKGLSTKEGFESLESCLQQGYPNNFCKRVPIQSWITCPQ
jgi:hypothetical protein